MKIVFKSTWLHSSITFQCHNDRLFSVPHLSKFNDCADDMKQLDVSYIENRWALIFYIKLPIGVKFNGFVYKMEQSTHNLVGKYLNLCMAIHARCSLYSLVWIVNRNHCTCMI